MTINEETTPQDRDRIEGLSSHLDIADLVRAVDERARAADERAKAADDRSQALAERVALLENDFQNVSIEKRPSLYAPYESERNIGSRRQVSLELGTRSVQDMLAYKGKDGDAIQTVVGVAEDNDYDGIKVNAPSSDLEERLDLIERRLQECEDTTRGTINQNEYVLPESTFSFFVTEHPLSSPFIFAVFTSALSITCLILVLADSVSSGTASNRINVPAGVSSAVRAAQFLGLLVGVLFEDECPQGLQHLAYGAGHTLLLNGTKKIHKRLMAVSILRLLVGYLFLSSLFMNVVQNSEVIDIFYDVLALEFVENIDDTAYALAKKGFLGQKLLVATVKKHTIEIQMSDTMRRSVVMSRDLFGDNQKSVSRDVLRSGTMISNSRSNNVARSLYFLNGITLLIGLAYISVMQSHGEYRCRRVYVEFSEEIWDKATIVGSTNGRLLVYPYFNGVYAADGSVGGHPRYVEQDKFSGIPFVNRKGAEIKYCDEIKSWVFMHSEIESSDNSCKWLFRSYQTTPETDYDIVAAAQDPWMAWIGEVVWDSHVSIDCITCSDDSDCSYQGICEKGVCSCNSGRRGHHCEFESPCPELATEKAERVGSPGSPEEHWVHENPITLMNGQVYTRPVYIQTNLTDGRDPFDWRMFRVRQREPTSVPSIQPSEFPSLFYSLPSPPPAPQSAPSLPPTNLATSTNFTATSVTSTNFTPPHATPIQFDPSMPTDAPTKPWYEANEYEVDVEDFAEHDDFFESKPLHDLEDIMQNYSVVMSFTGSRFYATIVEPNATFDDIFPQDYHAFWQNSFDANRTFVISDKTGGGTPIGLDFFEMRRRVPSLKNENVEFAYGPYGALIPNMNYKGSGFFHCLNNTP